MDKSAVIFMSIVVAACGFAVEASAALPPQLPANHWGLVDYEGSPVPDGYSVRVKNAGDEDFTQDNPTTINGCYDVIALTDDPETPEREGYIEGEMYTVYINGKRAVPDVSHIIGSNRTDLTAPVQLPLQLIPQP